MRSAFRRIVCAVGHPSPKIVALALALGVVIGVAIGPQVRLSFWTTVLDRWPSELGKMRAADRLADTEVGQQVLRRRFLSPDQRVRELAILDLVDEATGWVHLDSFIGEFGESPHRYVAERCDLLYFLDYADFYRMHLGTLCLQIKHDNAPQVKAEARRVLQSFADINVAKLAQRMGVSLANDRGRGEDHGSTGIAPRPGR